MTVHFELVILRLKVMNNKGSWGNVICRCFVKNQSIRQTKVMTWCWRSMESYPVHPVGSKKKVWGKFHHNRADVCRHSRKKLKCQRGGGGVLQVSVGDRLKSFSHLLGTMDFCTKSPSNQHIHFSIFHGISDRFIKTDGVNQVDTITTSKTNTLENGWLAGVGILS